eukprot:snap_masked-scaffold_43-processed-gene-1.44-mRNA-1 protein AED:1.00 eAED:1.00 QI:0/0/0/0/1/1/3/0/59
MIIDFCQAFDMNIQILFCYRISKEYATHYSVTTVLKVLVLRRSSSTRSLYLVYRNLKFS